MPRISSMNSVASWADCSDSDEDFDFTMTFQKIGVEETKDIRHEQIPPRASPRASAQSPWSPQASLSPPPSPKKPEPEETLEPVKEGSVRDRHAHCNVPRTTDFTECTSRSENTTVMVRNIPNRYNQRDLMADIHDLGFDGCFDFLYLPVDAKMMKNVGYGFVNFLEAAQAISFMEALQKHRFRRYKYCTKVASCSWAHLQGLSANLQHYERCAVRHAHLQLRRPVVLASNPQIVAPGCW